MKTERRLVAENLKNWYFIDSVLFNDYADNVIQDEGLLEEYNKSKEALLNNLTEMYSYVGYKSSRYFSDDAIQLKKMAVDDAIKTKTIAANMIKHESVKNSVKKRVIREFAEHPSKKYLTEFADKLIKNRFKKLCLDNILIGVPVIESKRKDNINDFRFQMLEEAYYLLRNSLIKISNVVNEALADYGIVRVLGFAIPDTNMGTQIQRDFQQQTAECDKIQDKLEKAVELAKIKVNTMKRILMAIQIASKKATTPSARDKFVRDIARAKERMVQYQAALAKATMKYREAVRKQQQKQVETKAQAVR